MKKPVTIIILYLLIVLEIFVWSLGLIIIANNKNQNLPTAYVTSHNVSTVSTNEETNTSKPDKITEQNIIQRTANIRNAVIGSVALGVTILLIDSLFVIKKKVMLAYIINLLFFACAAILVMLRVIPL